jgi:ribosomal protein S18 acetylase RimI-like enzyme
LIRRAVSTDADQLARIQIETWRVAYRGILADAYLDSLQIDPRIRWWERFIGNGAAVHLAQSDHDVVGFCSVGASDDRGWGEVFAIYVHPSRWDEGHGGRLIAAGEEALRQQGFARALLWVLEGNHRARSFYERQGWSLGRPFRIEEIGGVQVGEVRYETWL